MASPRPVPVPGSFVVKNGSNTRLRVSTSMPVPVSVTINKVYGALMQVRSLSSYAVANIERLEKDRHGSPRWHRVVGIGRQVHDDSDKRQLPNGLIQGFAGPP